MLKNSAEKVLKARLQDYGVTEEDLQYLRQIGKSPEAVLKEAIALSGPKNVASTEGPATTTNGFARVLDLKREILPLATEGYEQAIQSAVVANFRPASGAASRQFRVFKTIVDYAELHGAGSVEELVKRASVKKAALEAQEKTDALKEELDKLKEVIETFPGAWQSIENRTMAFSMPLEKAVKSAGKNLARLLKQNDFSQVLQFILKNDGQYEKGLGYASLPKALLAFHRYDKNGKTEVRVALEEHIRELIQRSPGIKILRIEFTISEDHETLFIRELNKILKNAEIQDLCKQNEIGAVDIRISFQGKHTDTVSLDLSTGQLVRKDGRLALRAGGHGSLEENVTALSSHADVQLVEINNIDNILWEDPVVKALVALYKRALIALAHELNIKKNEYVKYLRAKVLERAALSAGAPARGLTWIMENDQELSGKLTEIEFFLKNELTAQIPEHLARTPEMLLKILDRPLLVAGYVPASKDFKGGSPSIAYKELGDGIVILNGNTVEGSEMSDEDKALSDREGDLFNPVNLVMATEGPDGEKYNLARYSNPQRYFSSVKNGVKAYEHPGLWNGAVEGMLQVSVATPISVFRAVKTAAGKESFLSALHQPSRHDLQNPVGLVTDEDLKLGIIPSARELGNVLASFMAALEEYRRRATREKQSEIEDVIYSVSTWAKKKQDSWL